jgi:hypothetical protein
MDNNIICNYCSTKITKQNLSRHQKSDFCLKIQNIIKKNNDDKLILGNKIIELENEIKILTNNLKSANKSSEEYRKIVEKAATKSTNTVKNTYTHNNYLNYISTEPLKISDFPKQLKNIVNCDSVMYNEDDFHDHIVDNILRDKSGKDKVLCTDINRKNFTYKDEKSGELISDPELERLRNQLKKGTNIKQLRHELLEKLVTEYEENNCIGTDPYKRFSDIIQKLNFGLPFVDHVAKKTYVKTKNVGQLSCDENSLNLNQEETDNEFSELVNEDSFDEEEYQKLLEEFGNE